MEQNSRDLPEAYQLADYLVGPFTHEIITGPGVAIRANEQASEALDVNSPDSPEHTDPSQHPTQTETLHGLEGWQVPFYRVALNALRSVCGHERVPQDWVPQPAQGAELYRQLAYHRKMHGMVRGLNQFISDYKTGRTETLLREDQQEVMDDIAASLTQNGTERQITVKSATGTGKTAILINLIRGLKSQEQPNDQVGVVLLVPSKDILNRTIEAFEQFAPEIEVGQYYADSKEMRKVTIMVNRSFDIAVRRGTLTRDMVDVVIKDEEHETWGKKIGESLENFCTNPETGEHKALFGFSATPSETENIAHEKTILEAVDRGIVSPFSITERRTTSTIHEIRELRKKAPEDYTEEELNSLINDDPRNQIIIQEVLSGLADGRRVAVRCLPGGELEHPRLLFEKLRAIKTPIVDPYTGIKTFRRIRPIVIAGSMPSRDRKLALKAFNNPFMDGSDGLDVLLFVDTLTRGFDSPILGKIINSCPSLSWTVMEQLLGRIVRYFKRMDGSIQYKQAVDIVDESVSGQVTFSDVISHYAPTEQRYIHGKIIGKGLRDPRYPQKDDQGKIFEVVPPEEYDAFMHKQSTWRPGPQAFLEKKQAEQKKTERPKAEGKPRSPKKPSTSRPTVIGHTVDMRAIPEEDRVGVEATMQANPFEEAQPITPELAANSISLNDAAESLETSIEDLRFAIFDTQTAVYKDEQDVYHLTPIAMRRLRAYLGDTD